MKQITKEMALEAVEKAKLSLNSFLKQECLKKFFIYGLRKDIDYTNSEILFSYSGFYGKEFVFKKGEEIFCTDKCGLSLIYKSSVSKKERELICQKMNFSQIELEKVREEVEKLEQEYRDSIHVANLVEDSEASGFKIYQ